MSDTRILHIVGGMNRGGVETWLMHVLRQINRNAFHMDFLVHASEPCAYDDEIRALGSRIIPCTHPSRPWIYAHNFKRILREYGPYDVVHSHVHHYSGYTLRLAYQAGVPVRIAHSHNDTVNIDARAGLRRKLYLALMEHWISRYVTMGLACSNKAGQVLFRRHFSNKTPWETFYCGIDTAPFDTRIDSCALRAELNISPDAFVIGHVGRFDEQKNHAFIIEIAAELARRDSNMCLLLVGDGPLRTFIKERASRAGITSQVIFCGIRDDVPRLMLGAMDVFCFPSLWEGLPLTLMEAQAAGLPCIISDVITQETDIAPQLITRVSTSQSGLAWADAILRIKASKTPRSLAQALALVKKSPFNSVISTRKMEKLYANR